ncbi:class I SAM-dependent methyltransferase [Halobaculum sp. MBLA0147]|uniref:class I SAM-dependent methyltransferase n=1 Tax=Halobaculum sp. MBLA0147 TaxID=3079934 RepID=UPI0035264DAD
MEEHIIDAERAEVLEDETRYQAVSREEILRIVDSDDVVVDIGSGTGFFTDDLATHAQRVFAVDFQDEMHEYYKKKGIPGNVQTIQSKASQVDITGVDVIVSLFSFHEIDIDSSIEKFNNMVGESAQVLIVDWSKNAETDEIPPREKLFTATEAADALADQFTVQVADERYNTFSVLATQ